MLGISATALKKACRRLGVQRWPYTFEHRLDVLAQAGGVAHAMPVPHTGGRVHRPENTGSAVSAPSPWLDYSYVRKIQRKHCASRSHRNQPTSGLSGEKIELLGEDANAGKPASGHSDLEAPTSTSTAAEKIELLGEDANAGKHASGHSDLDAPTSTSTAADFTACQDTCHTAADGACSAGRENAGKAMCTLIHSTLEAPTSACDCSTGSSTAPALVLL